MSDTATGNRSTQGAPPNALDKKVAVIGGGIAGITAAVKLYRQGFDVTIFEKEAVLGGNLSSNSPDNKNQRQDVYPHIFGDWYKEFWYLLEEDLELSREKCFVRRDKIRMAEIPNNEKTCKTFSDIKFDQLGTPTSLANLFDNLNGNIISKRDMFLFGYTYLELASIPEFDNPSKIINKLDVTGYLNSRPYMNDSVADFHDDILKVIWSMPSDETSAKAYRNLLRHTITFPNETPFAWLVRGPIEQTLMTPITRKLENKLGPGKVRLGKEVTRLGVVKDGDRSNYFLVDYNSTGASQSSLEEAGGSSTEQFRYVVVATQPGQVLKFAFQPSQHGAKGRSLVSLVPSVVDLRQAQGGRIPVVYLYFNKAFVDRHQNSFGSIPKEIFGFKQRLDPAAAPDNATASAPNNYDISILDISGLWPPSQLKAPKPGCEVAREPVFVLAASSAREIPALGPEDLQPGAVASDGTAQGFEMIKMLAQYLPFLRPGSEWGHGGDVDWDRTCVITNAERLLFLNDADSESWRPTARVSLPGRKGAETLANLFFAGDYCRTDVDMATIEAAVQSGVLAAQALQESAGSGHPIDLQPHDIYASSPLLLTKLLAAPAAFAVALSQTYDKANLDPILAMRFPADAVDLAVAYGADWMRSATQLWSGMLPQKELSPSGGLATEDVPDHDNRIGLTGAAANLALAVVTEGPALAPQITRAAAEGLYSAWHATIGKKLFPGLPGGWRSASAKAAPPAAARVPTPQPGTWSYLLRQAVGPGGVTPRGVMNAAYGAATVALAALQYARTEIAAPAPTGLTRKDSLRNAMADGDAALRARRMRFRGYHTVNGPL